MKLRIKTAHGYLSFQPDGRLEYRDGVGAWEEIDVEGLDLRSLLPPDLPAPVDPPPPVVVAPPIVDPLPVADLSAAYVAAVKAQLVAQGVNLLGPCGAFAITKRVAWGLRAVGAGLLSKPYGNHCDGYATDIVCWPHVAYDILSDGGATNGPIWIDTGVDDLRNRWRPPVEP